MQNNYKSQEDLLEELIKEVKEIKILLRSGRKVDLGIMDVPEVLAALKISLKTLRNWTEQGILRAVKIGGRVYYRKKDIIDMVNEHFSRQ